MCFPSYCGDRQVKCACLATVEINKLSVLSFSTLDIQLYTTNYFSLGASTFINKIVIVVGLYYKIYVLYMSVYGGLKDQIYILSSCDNASTEYFLQNVTAGQIFCIFGWDISDVPVVDLLHYCSLGGATIIFLFSMNILLIFWESL